MKTFDEIKNKVHDISGIKNPKSYWFEKINGIFYPTKLNNFSLHK